jgi:2-phosphosulfolactate phosphatase
MEIQVLEFIEGAKKAEGLAVIIDVFRAFSVDCYVARNGAEKIIPVGDINLAYRLKEENPGYILMGERNERIQPGFDYGNSPARIENVDFTGKTVVQTTSAGTQGIANAKGASGIITGSFVNAGAVIRYIQKKAPGKVSLVAMGYAGSQPTDEDLFCAQYIRDKLMGQAVDFDAMVEKLKVGSGKRFFLAANQERSPFTDFELCLDLDAVDFVLKAVPREDGLVELVKA